MLIRVEPTNLHKTSVFTQTYAEHFLRNYSRIKHRVVYRLLSADAHASAHSEPQDAVGGLVVEELGLLRYAAEGEIESILSELVLVSKENFISDHEALVA